MKANYKKIIYTLSSILLIFLAWHIFSKLEDNNFILPDIKSTFSSLFDIIGSNDFLIIIFSSFLRVLIGLALGTILGALFACISHYSEFVRCLISPIMSIIKATPVASFIIILWIKFDGDEVAVLIALLMVMPIIWQNVLDGFNSIDNGLSEVCTVYEFSNFKKIRLLILPTLLRYFIPGIITSVGLAWKAEIATEIIAYTANSIGQQINDSKFSLDSPSVFAWTIIVIVLSVLLEMGTKFLLRRCKKWVSD